jgi:hypothetical protein
MTLAIPKKWFAGADFTTDWTSRAFDDWSEHLGHLRNKRISILEIGAWEGRGSLFFLNFFRNSTLTPLDIFTLGNEGLFDHNVLEQFPDRVTKVKGRSTIELDQFAVEGRAFDLIYLDGSHLRDDVMIDSILAWRLLKVGGYLIWDDYELIKAMPGHFPLLDQDPMPAIDAFGAWHNGEMEVVHRDYQLIAKKVSNHYRQDVPGQEELVNSSSKLREATERLAETEESRLEVTERLAATEASRREITERLAETETSLRRSDSKLEEAQTALDAAKNQAEAQGRKVAALEAELAATRQAKAMAEASLARSVTEFAMLTNLLHEQEVKYAALLDHVEWLNRVAHADSHQPGLWGLLPRNVRVGKQRERRRQRGLFDANAYLGRNPDVEAAGMDPFDHYVRHGFLEGRAR